MRKEDTYIVTVRDGYGEKIASRVTIEGECATIADVLRQHSYDTRIYKLKQKFVDKYKTSNFLNWWIATVPPSPPPPPKPLVFDDLVNMNMV